MKAKIKLGVAVIEGQYFESSKSTTFSLSVNKNLPFRSQSLGLGVSPTFVFFEGFGICNGHRSHGSTSASANSKNPEVGKV